jgi:pre-mRNA-splicing factor ISY1
MSVPNEGIHDSKQTVPIVGPEADQARVHAQAAASYIPFLTTEDLLPPKMPTREEMETVLLGLRKQALVEEYFGVDGAS